MWVPGSLGVVPDGIRRRSLPSRLDEASTIVWTVTHRIRISRFVALVTAPNEVGEPIRHLSGRSAPNLDGLADGPRRNASRPMGHTLDGAACVALQDRMADQKRTWRRRGQPWDPSSVPLAMHKPLSAYPPSSVAPSVSMSLSRALHRAGVTREGVRPRSVREFAANRTYAQTGRVENVAELLGLSSLDAAAHFVDHQWQDRWGGLIRAGVSADG